MYPTRDVTDTDLAVSELEQDDAPASEAFLFTNEPRQLP